MVIKGYKSVLFVDLTKIYKIKTYRQYGDNFLEALFWDNNKNEYDSYILQLRDDANLEKAIDGLFVAIQKCAKTVDLNKYVEDKKL